MWQWVMCGCMWHSKYRFSSTDHYRGVLVDVLDLPDSPICICEPLESLIPIVQSAVGDSGYFLNQEEDYERHNYAGELLDVGAILGGAFEALGIDAGDSAGANFTELYNYHGPTPVMDFNQFVQASRFIQGQADAIDFDIGSLDPT